MARDYYEILGVSRSASEDEVKRSFRKKAHELHPDKEKGDETKFKELNEAYQILRDPEKRKTYDQFGSVPGAGAGGFRPEDFARQGPFGRGFGGDASGQGFGFNIDDLGEIFGDIFGGGRQERRPQTSGRDIEMEATINFEDAVFGTQKTFSLRKAASCSVCKGSGAEPGTRTVSCSSCGGSGTVSQMQHTVLGQMRAQTLCPTCNGDGQTIEKKCRHCGGDGLVDQTSEVEVRIPPGIDEGQTLRLSGKGEAGRRSGKPGDLFIHVRVLPSKEFQRDGENISTAQTISFPLAALGGTLSVRTIDGEGELEIPSGTQSGQVFRLRGKGVPRLNASGRGDQHVTITVEIPKKLTRKQKQLLREFEEEG